MSKKYFQVGCDRNDNMWLDNKVTQNEDGTSSVHIRYREEEVGFNIFQHQDEKVIEHKFDYYADACSFARDVKDYDSESTLIVED